MRRKMSRPNRTRSEKKTRRRNALRMVLSLLLLLLCAFPMFGGGVQPLSVIPALVCICMNETFYFSIFCGALSGLLIDVACGSVLGSNALFLLVFSAFASLLFERLLRPGFWHFLWLTFVCAAGRGALSYLLTAVLFRVEGRELLFREILLPSLILTMIISLLVYLLYLPCGRLLTKRVRPLSNAVMRFD